MGVLECSIVGMGSVGMEEGGRGDGGNIPKSVLEKITSDIGPGGRDVRKDEGECDQCEYLTGRTDWGKRAGDGRKDELVRQTLEVGLISPKAQRLTPASYAPTSSFTVAMPISQEGCPPSQHPLLL